MSGGIGKAGTIFSLSCNSAKLLAHLINFVNRRCHVNPKCSNIHPANLNRPAYSRYKYIRANFRHYYSLLNVHILNRQSGSKGRFAYSSRHRLLILLEWAETKMKVLQGNDTLKLQITFYRHVPGWRLMISHLPDPTLLLSTFKLFLLDHSIRIPCDSPYLLTHPQRGNSRAKKWCTACSQIA